MPTPSAPQYLEFHQQAVSPGTTSITPLFSTPTPALSFIVSPLADNADAVLVGIGGAPLGPINVDWAALVNGRYYNLADLSIQCVDSTDGVLVTWIT